MSRLLNLGEHWKKAPNTKHQTPEKLQAPNTKHQRSPNLQVPNFVFRCCKRSRRKIAAKARTCRFWDLEFGAYLVFGVWDLVFWWVRRFRLLVTTLAVLFFAPDSFAAPGVVCTTDGKSFEGDIALDLAAVTVTATNGVVEKISLTNLASLKIQPPAPSSPSFKKGNGNGLLGTYFQNVNLTGPAFTRLDETVDFNWGMMAPMAGMIRDYFGVRWTGEVEAPASGDYTFYVQTDDGGRLWVNGQLLVDQWRSQGMLEGNGHIQLEGGKKYEIKMEQFDNFGNAMARLWWSGPGIERSIVPKSQLYTTSPQATNAPPDKGLLGIYFQNSDFTGTYVTRIDPVISFDWSQQAPVGGLDGPTFSVRWIGKVQPKFSEHYTFHTETDSGVRLWINDRLVLDQWKEEPLILASVPMELKAGVKCDLRMETSNASGRARARLYWSSPSTPRSIIPPGAFSPGKLDVATIGAAPTNAEAWVKGVVLTSGSFLAGGVQSADETRVKFPGDRKQFSVSTLNVARVVFQNVSADVASRIQGRQGILMQNRDFIDGEIKAIENGKVKITSVLFGLQSYDLATKVAAVVWREVTPAAWPYQVKTQAGDVLLVGGIGIEKEAFVITDATLRGFKVPLHQLLEMTRNTAPEAAR